MLELAVLIEGILVLAPGKADTVSSEGSRKGNAVGITRGYSLSIKVLLELFAKLITFRVVLSPVGIRYLGLQ